MKTLYLVVTEKIDLSAETEHFDHAHPHGRHMLRWTGGIT